jgi:hypothetical protein
MHCIVPFAAPATDAGREVLKTMQWPRLASLLAGMALVERDEAEPTSFSPPHERALARALGWRVDGHADGRWPLAAHWARADGIDVGSDAWGLVSPVHWRVGTDQVSLADPQALQLDEPTSRRLFDAARPLFEEAGSSAAGEGAAHCPRLVFGHAARWYVAHASLDGLRAASLDRVAGRNVDPWLVHGGESPAQTAALRRWRRLQAEVQMLLHTHPLNAEREARGLPVINSFWLSGCGRAQPVAQAPAPPRVDETLRAAALAEDWAAWAAGWRRIESGVLTELASTLERGETVTLTLAGERTAATYAPAGRGVVARLKGLVARPDVPALLASL